MHTETLGSQCTAGIAVICIREIIEHGQIDRIDADRCASDSHCWKNPVLGWERGPAKPKHANWKAAADDAAGEQPPLRVRVRITFEKIFLGEVFY